MDLFFFLNLISPSPTPKSLYWQPALPRLLLELLQPVSPMSLRGTLEGLNPGQVFQRTPVQVDDRTNHHDVHDLVAVAPVVKESRHKALRDLDNVDQSSQYGQRVHDDEEAQRVGAAHPAAKHPEEEEAEAEQRLPHEGPQPQDVGAGSGGAVDPVGRQQDVGEQGGPPDGRVAEEGDVDDGESSW